jgi:CHAT domain-containing protein
MRHGYQIPAALCTLWIASAVVAARVQGDPIRNAIAAERRDDAILEQQLALGLATGSERDKQAFARRVAERTDRTISLHLLAAPADPDAASLAALVVLQRKGRVQDAMASVFAAVRGRASAEDGALMDELNATLRRLARIALAPAGTAAAPETFAALETRKERLEATLSERSADFRSEVRPVTLDAVEAAIPDHAALIEYAVFRPFDEAADGFAGAYGEPHYAAYVLRNDALPRGVDLGPVAPIDAAVDQFRDALRRPGDPAADAHGRALYARTIEPLRPLIGSAKRLLVSPDGNLNLLPFDALVDPHGHYLIERYATTYLTSGRDLLRMQVPRAAGGPPVIVADPLFGEAAAPPDHYFAPLSGSGAEARVIKQLFPGASLLTGSRASKAALEQVHGPWILHIASHGFFLGSGGDRAGPAATNPLLRSGLALAGANRADLARGDGILTALEASGLDLWGTELVTLSACDTAVGQVRNGEGVYGLRRAFVLAGAETLVMSLWPVSDYVARDAMIGYYTRLRAGLGRGDALRAAKLGILRQPNRRNPYYWAGFIQSGDWRPLDPSRAPRPKKEPPAPH